MTRTDDLRIEKMLEENSTLQAELTKARELLELVYDQGDTDGLIGEEISGFLSNQSAPADKGQGEPKCETCHGTGVVDDGEITDCDGVPFENGPIKCVKDCPACSAPVAVVPDLAELREYHSKAVKDLEHYADDSGLRESDVKHYRKRAGFHSRQVKLIDEVARLNGVKP